MTRLDVLFNSAVVRGTILTEEFRVSVEFSRRHLLIFCSAFTFVPILPRPPLFHRAIAIDH